MTTPRLLGARYEIGETLGYGGMAEVHLGRDVRLGREVAVKVLRADLARDPSFQARFRREAQAAASLNHPAVVAVYDTGEDITGPNGSTPYIVMEYVEGRTLREVLKAEGPLMPRRAMEIVADICAALDFSHRNGIVHRDVKPGNVMITRSGAVKVMDFGIARAVADNAATVTATAAVIGTAQYLSPEQARGESVDARSDVYSTGCLLYELVTGHPPFTGDSPVAVAYQHVRENAAPPSTVNPDVPPPLDAIVMKSMAKNPANRYQTAADMRADLIRAINGRPVSAEPVLVDDERTAMIGTGGYGGYSTDYGPTYPPGYGTQMRPAAEDPSRQRRRTMGWIALAVAVLLVFVLAAFLTSRLLSGGGGGGGSQTQSVQVPDLQGKNRAEAERLIRAAGLKPAVRVQASTIEQKNKVLIQDPQEGFQAALGSTVTITVGAGPAQVAVPQVVGLSYEQAVRQLEAVKLNPVPKQVDSKQPANTVVDSDPQPGTRVAEGAQVTLSVSSGKVAIPNVVGKTEAEARQILNQAGFLNVVSKTATPPDDFEPGIVFQTDPTADSRAPLNQQITLLVATKKPPKPSPTPSPSPSVSVTPSPPPTTSPTP